MKYLYCTFFGIDPQYEYFLTYKISININESK